MRVELICKKAKYSNRTVTTAVQINTRPLPPPPLCDCVKCIAIPEDSFLDDTRTRQPAVFELCAYTYKCMDNLLKAKYSNRTVTTAF